MWLYVLGLLGLLAGILGFAILVFENWLGYK